MAIQWNYSVKILILICVLHGQIRCRMYLYHSAMSFIQELSLCHFKNYRERSFRFDKRIVCIHGPNGSGKTSILDAIHFLCFSKSYFHYNDSLCLMRGESGMRIHGKFGEPGNDEVICILRENGRKELLMNGEAYAQFSKHIGKFPCVFIAPDDTHLITEGSEDRRKFLDAMISQSDHRYLEQLIQYNRFLAQRNALLKQWATSTEKDFSLLSVYSKRLHETATPLFQKRKQVLSDFLERVRAMYAFLCESNEVVDIRYQSQLHEAPLLDMLDRFIDHDLHGQRTHYGIHKDDLVFTLNTMPMKQAASQGQRKSFLFSLKLAQYEMLRAGGGKEPILLLDDIFEKLDAYRSRQLIRYLLDQKGQVFITDTHIDRLQQAFAGHESDVMMIGL